MVNKKILMSCLLILLVAISVSAASAADVAVDDAVVAMGNTIIVDGDDDVAVSNAMANATDGDIIELGDSGYTFNNGIEVTKMLTFHGNNATIYANGSQMPDGVFVVKADGAGTAFHNISFINIDDADNYLYKYNGMVDAKGKSVKTSVGIAIDVDSAADNVFIENCYFQNWFNSAVSINSANYVTVIDSQFYGGSATFINNIPDGPKDRGTYHISVMSSRGTTVDRCYFGDTVCDGVSVAGGSYDSTIINNVFENNAFSIYFGGKATEGTLIAGNTFINSGWFESDVYGPNGTTGETVNFQDLPVISVQKSSDSFVIAENTFYARNANMLIKALEGSTAHGGESNIGNISITDNTVLGMDKYDSSFGNVVMASVFLTYIETYNDVIRPIGEIKIANNKLNGARSAVYWTQKWGDDLGDVSIKQAPLATSIAISSLKDSTIKAVLKDIDGKGVGSGIISYTSDSGNGSVETEFDGSFIIEGVSGAVDLEFAAFDNYKGTTASVDVAPAVSQKINMTIEATFYSDNNQIIATLTNDATGKVVSGANVIFSINGVETTVKSNSKGQAKLYVDNLPLATYTAIISYAGNDKYNAASTNVVFTPTPKADIIISDARGDANEFTATLINSFSGKAISGVSVTVDINGVKTTVKSNSKGQIKVSTADAGDSYTATISYKGNAKYNAVDASTTVVLAKTNMDIVAKYYSSKDQFVATVTNADTGKAITNVNIKVCINGLTLGLKTDSKGQITISTADLRPGTYVGVFSYVGNDKYNAACTTATATIAMY